MPDESTGSAAIVPDDSGRRDADDLARALPGGTDTIAAIATATGRGAVAIVRVSGPEAHAIVARIVSRWPGQPRRVVRCTVRDAVTGEPLDDALVTRFDAPASYTGEDGAELATHGGLAVPAAVLAALVAAGAREAEPGEFTRRALLRGKLDLLQAEAVADLVDARSSAMRRAALRQLDGGLSRRVSLLRDGLLDLEALLAYDIDFPEEDDGPIARERVLLGCDDTIAKIAALLATAPSGELAREGAAVVIAGAPNAGKSALFNALLGQPRALVTSVPGTTRDAIEAVLDQQPVPLRLVDTAGLRETSDVVERLGIEVSEAWLARADLVLACGEDEASVRHAIARVALHATAPVVGVRTKADLDAAGGMAASVRAAASEASAIDASLTRVPDDAYAIIPVSAELGTGLQALLDVIGRRLAARLGSGARDDGGDASVVVLRARHARALREASAELHAFRDAWAADQLPAPVAAVHLRSALHALETLTGAVDVEEVLGRVFSRFCVGK